MKENCEHPPLSLSKPPINTINGIKFTSREIDILAFILAGRTAKKIASFLSLSPKTVENYICNIMLRLQCNSRMSIIDFLESSDNAPYLKRHYAALLGKPSLEQPLSLSGDESSKVFEVGQNTSFLQKRVWKYATLGFLVLMYGLGFTAYKYYNNKVQVDVIRSDLVIPTESVFLNRTELMTQLDNGFKGKEGIQTIALAGVGGSGKTTTARQYAHQQRASLIWEINAETKNSLIESFENLAHALATTKEDKRSLRELTEIKNSSEREKKLVEFVKGYLKASSNWFLIYDNVEKFTDIQKYFPCDFETWGQGKVVITTRDINIQNSKHVNRMVQIGELDADQKLILFSIIMNAEKKDTFSSLQQKETRTFLENIPPYPLDISVAAYYVKSTNTPYTSYLESLKLHHKEFANVQARLLKEQGDYFKTRYSIVSISCQKLIDTHKDFADLLLLISILDSQNIPIELLKKYKEDYIVDDFIYNLRKYSLIITASQITPHLIPTIFIHRSTQAIALAYVEQRLSLEKKRELVQGCVNTLISYADRMLDEQNFSLITLLLNHYEKFLSHANLLTESSKNSITRELAYMYYECGNSIKTKKYLEQGLKSLNEGYNKGDASVIRPLIYLGGTYREVGNYENAKEVLEKTLKLIKQYPNLQGELGSALIYLGTTYRDLGNYEKAKKILGQSVRVLKQNLPTNNSKFAEASAFTGIAHWMSGDYVKAQNYLEQSYVLYKKFFPENHLKVGWTCSWLANIYGDLGHDEKAKDLLEQSLDILKSYHKTNERGFALFFLGNIYRKLGNYEKAYALTNEGIKIIQEVQPDNQIRLADAFTCLGVLNGEMGEYKSGEKILKYCLSIYEKKYGNKHIKYAEILKELGSIYLRAGYLDKAESFFQKSLETLKENNHTGAYLVLENLADLYLKKFIPSVKNESNQQVEGFKAQAISYLKQALEIVKTRFPANSPHLERIQLKLQAIEES